MGLSSEPEETKAKGKESERFQGGGTVIVSEKWNVRGIWESTVPLALLKIAQRNFLCAVKKAKPVLSTQRFSKVPVKFS